MYSNSIYQDVRRLWFGYKRGSSAPGFGAAHPNSEAENLNYVERFYPKGPIKILKFGAIAASTNGKGEQMMSLYRNGSRLATAVCSTSSSEYVVDSVAVNKICAAGSYLNIIASTNVCSTGSVSCFVDYVPLFDNSGKWAAGKQDGRANRVAA
jgi:hypothetical protein